MSNRLSIIIPVYNSGLYLTRCIESIFEQNVSDIEIILINDGSTDNSLILCESYKNKYDNIFLISQENRGVSAARNRGLDMATGSWIIFMDADDYLLPGALSFFLDVIDSNPECHWILASSLKEDKGKILPHITLKSQVIRNPILSVKHYALWGYAFNSKIIRENKLRFIETLSYSEDRVFIYQYAFICERLHVFDEPVYVYRINETSACASKNYEKKAKNQIAAAGYLRRYFIDSLDSTAIKKTIRKECMHTINLGLYCLAQEFTRDSINRIKNEYIANFGTRNLSLFYFMLAYNRLRVIRRRFRNCKC